MLEYTQVIEGITTGDDVHALRAIFLDHGLSNFRLLRMMIDLAVDGGEPFVGGLFLTFHQLGTEWTFGINRQVDLHFFHHRSLRGGGSLWATRSRGWGGLGAC
jgi:hypothetical protein